MLRPLMKITGLREDDLWAMIQSARIRGALAPVVTPLKLVRTAQCLRQLP